MKYIKLINPTVLALGVAIVLAGCKTQPVKTTILPDSGANMKGGGLDSGQKFDSGTPIADANGNHAANDPSSHAGYTPDATALKAQTVYFDLDKSAIKPSEQSKLDEVASYLKSNPGKAVRVEGNCDERGTEEYNRSLGERRAEAAREYLITAGIDGQRVDTLTNGEDKPAEKGHSEEAWSKNRRDEFIVLSPPGL